MQENLIKRTEEVQDIIDRMPQRTGRFVAIIVTGLAALLLFLGWSIKYPEVVQGSITITAKHAPVKLVTKLSGKLNLLNHRPNDLIREGEIIALIESPADLQNITTVQSLLETFDPDKPVASETINKFPRNTNLGELTEPYFNFLNAAELFVQYSENNIFSYRREEVLLSLKAKKDLIKQLELQQSLKEQNQSIATNALHKDSIQYFKIKGISETDLERSKFNYLNVKEGALNIQKEITSSENLINELNNRLDQLRVEQTNHEQNLKINLVTTYNTLKNSIKQWLMNYTFKAPFTGKIEFLDFWRDHDFVESGKEIFSVVPEKNVLQGHIYLPVQGAGKVAPGLEVIIKLDNFPYMEYGSINGKVKEVSLLANKVKGLEVQANLNVYLVTVDLINGLTTNYGTKLGFQYEIKGGADIITNKRRLIERLFDNLKYIANK